MAHLYRRLSLRERYQLQAPYTPAETGASFHLPDHNSEFFDLVATTLVGPYYFRTIPTHFETSPEWEEDVLCTFSGARCLVNSHAKLVEIPASHRAWIQYNGFVTHMIKNGADVDIYGRGLVHINIYGIKEENWSDPQIMLDHQHELHHGYASDKLIEAVVEGLGRKRAEALARLVVIAKSKGGLGGLGTTFQALETPTPTILAIGATLNSNEALPPSPGRLVSPRINQDSPASAQLQASAPPKETKTTHSAPTGSSSSETSTVVTPTTDLVRQATQKNAGLEKKSPSPPAKSRLPPRRPTPPTAASSPAPAKASPSTLEVENASAQNKSTAANTGSPRTTSRKQAAGSDSVAHSSTTTEKLAPAMERSPAMEAPKITGKSSRALSGAQRQKLKKLAKQAGAAATQTLSPPSPSPSLSVACRTTLGGQAGSLRSAQQVLPAILEANTMQDLTTTKLPANGDGSGDRASTTGKHTTPPKKYLIVETNTRVMNLLGSRKRKTTPPQPSQHAENPNKNARPRCVDTSSKNGSQAASVVNKAQATITPTPAIPSSPKTPSRSNNANIATTPSRWLPIKERLARERELSGQSTRSYPSPYYYTGYNDRDYATGNGYERRGNNYYAEEFNNRYAVYYSSDYLVAYPPRYYSSLNYDDYQTSSRSSPNQPYSSRFLESTPSRQPLAAPLIPTKGPFHRRNHAGPSGDLGSSLATTTPISKPFSRAVSPPPTSRHSLRATAADFYPLPAKPAPPTSIVPRRRPTDSQSSAAQVGSHLPVKPIQTPFPFPFPTSTPFPATTSTSILAANTAELVETKGTVKKTKPVLIKSEEGVVESKLDNDGWQVVGKDRKVSANDVVKLAQALSRSRRTQVGSWINDQEKNCPSQPVAPTRPQPAKVSLSSLGTVAIEDEWNTDMDIDASGERFDRLCELHELTKSHRQNKIEKSRVKTSERRKRSSRQGNREATKGVGSDS
ncbi:hypothetical protein P7C70_g8036, partial [Phenoliferia sp. Uapishka_3]